MRKICALLLCALLCVGIFPVSMRAEETAAPVVVTIAVKVTGDTAEVTVKKPDNTAPQGLLVRLTVEKQEILPAQAVDANGKTSFKSEKLLTASAVSFVVDEQTVGETRYARAQKEVKIAPSLGFKFEAVSTFDKASGTLSVTWNFDAKHEAKVAAVVVGTKRHTVYDIGGEFSLYLGDTPPGTYKLTYVVEKKQTEFFESAPELIVAGVVKTQMKLTVVNGKIRAALSDTWGRSIADYPLVLQVGATTLSPQKTNAGGLINFNVAPPADLSTVICTAADREVGDISYVGCVGKLEGSIVPPTSGNPLVPTEPPTAPPPTEKRTTTRRPTRATTEVITAGTTAKTFPTIKGAGTTAMEGSSVALNVTLDTGILNSFGKKKEDFEGKARFFMSPGSYQDLTAGTNCTLMLSIRSSALQVTDDQVDAAKSNLSMFSPYSSEKIQRITMDFSMLMMTGDNEVALTALPDAEYRVQLPIPDSMKNFKLIAVSATGENGLSDPIVVTRESGYLHFTTRHLSSFTLLGFEEAKAGADGKGIPTLALVLICLGVALLIGAGLLLFFFVIRKPASPNGKVLK